MLKVKRKNILSKAALGNSDHGDDHVHHDTHEDDGDHDHDDNHEGHDHDDDHHHDHSHEEPAGPNRFVLAIRTALRDFVETAMYFSIGVAITAVFKAFVTEELIMVFNQSEATGVGLMMVLAFILSLCSTSDAFIAAELPGSAVGAARFSGLRSDDGCEAHFHVPLGFPAQICGDSCGFPVLRHRNFVLCLDETWKRPKRK